jgi:hypothetical protein
VRWVEVVAVAEVAEVAEARAAVAVAGRAGWAVPLPPVQGANVFVPVADTKCPMWQVFPAIRRNALSAARRWFAKSEKDGPTGGVLRREAPGAALACVELSPNALWFSRRDEWLMRCV